MTATPWGNDLTLSSVSRGHSIRGQVSDALRAALISGRMRPGIIYPAPTLAEMLGVSATPVREAMLDLVNEGLVQVVRNRGFRVTDVSDRELDELAEARLFLEVPVMGAVAANLTEGIRSELEAMRELARRLEAAAEADDLVTYMQADTEFHSQFLSLHGNEEIVKTVRQLRSRSRLYGLEKVARAGNLMRSTREHAQMIDLALAEDRIGLEQLVRQHIGHVRAEWAGTS